MINKKWLQISMFLPLWGAIIDLIICMRQFNRHLNKENDNLLLIKKIFSWTGILGAAFVGVMLLVALINEIIVKITGLRFDCIFLIAIVAAGYVTNVVFYAYYRKRIKPLCLKKTVMKQKKNMKKLTNGHYLSFTNAVYAWGGV